MKHAAKHKQNNSNSITIVCTAVFIIGIIIAAISLNRIIANENTNTSMTSMYSNSGSSYNTSSSESSSSVIQYNDDNKNCIGECK